jgi:metal-responsive CopG/Arc/MetJ family transcriptional regulator
MEDIMSTKQKPKGKGSKSKATSKGKRAVKAVQAQETVVENAESDRIAENAANTETTVSDEIAAGTTTEVALKRKRNMTIEDLRAEYLRVIGRETDSTDRRYLMWKLNEAAKGKIKIGPVQKRPARDKADIQVIPISLLRETTRLLDTAIKAEGIKSRSTFIRGAMIEKLRTIGSPEADAAANAISSEVC